MKTRIALAILTLLTSHAVFAETCPSVKDIRANHIAGWKAYDSDDGIPLSKARHADFVKSVDQFILAEWSKKGKKGHVSVHCFYRDVNGSDLEAYLTKENLAPKPGLAWYKVSGAMQCAAGSDQCKFSQLNEQKQLARK